MIRIGERTRLRPPAQLFQPLLHLNSVLFTSIAKFTVWTVDSQEGQQVASQVHDPPRRIRIIRLTRVASQRAGTAFRGGELLSRANYPTFRLRRRRKNGLVRLAIPKLAETLRIGFVRRSKWIVDDKSR
jgi:hypothetical protein